MTATPNTWSGAAGPRSRADFDRDVEALERDWAENPRWKGIERSYSAADVVALRGSLPLRHTLAEYGAQRLWAMLNGPDYVRALGAMTGGQAVQMVKAGLKAIYVSGWQVAADANLAGDVYPDQSLYPANSVPQHVRRINNALRRADAIEWGEGLDSGIDWHVPIVADAEAGFGGVLNAYELMKGMIEAGAAGIHFEDQLASEKKCGHLGGKVLVPSQQFVNTLNAARLAADVMGVPAVLVARTDALGANLLTSDVDERDRPFCTGDRTAEGFFRVNESIDQAVSRGLSYAPYADVVWCETSTPSLEEAKLDDATIAVFQQELADMGYRFQFITLAGFHSVNAGMFELSKGYAEVGMPAYVELQEREFEMEADGYTATRHQREVGAGFFDRVSTAVTAGSSSTLALKGSTEEAQFEDAVPTA